MIEVGQIYLASYRPQTAIKITSISIFGVTYKYVGTMANGLPYGKVYKDSRANCIPEDEFISLVMKGQIILDKKSNHISRMKAYGHAPSK
jgi:hypothetical protein